MTKSATLTSTGGKESSSRILGRPDKDFEFDQLSQIKVYCVYYCVGIIELCMGLIEYLFQHLNAPLI